VPEPDLDQAALYTYAQVDVSRTLRLTLGASADRVGAGLVDEQSVNPKLGLVWHPSNRVAVRAAFFETLEGSLTSSKQTPQPRLEPTEIAGFTQFLFAANGEQASVSGVGVDVEVAPRVFAGVEHARREANIPIVLAFPPPLSVVNVVPEVRDETQDRAYLYWTPTETMTLSAEYQYDRIEDRPIGLFGFTRMKAQRLPVELRYFGATGFTAGLRVSLVDQEGEFQQAGPGQDRFRVVDASIGYRLPKRRGVLSLNVDNLFDESFRFQDIDPENPSIMPERMAYLRFTFAFD
jgi:outer membrane receptor protein involved in Fe transport